MKNYFGIDCHTVMDTVYKSGDNEPASIITQIRLYLHTMFCPQCNMELRILSHTEEIMESDFLPPAPDLEEQIMKSLDFEAVPGFLADAHRSTASEAPGGFSFRTWIIIGFFMLISLSSSFFGVNFSEIASKEGRSFLLPVGITIGIAVTCYGAFLIASHLKELSSRFDIH